MTARKKGLQQHKWRPFQEARAFVGNFGLKSVADWDAWAKSNARSENIPASPGRVYRGKGWVSWEDWLGTRRLVNQNRVYRPFREARSFVHSLGLQSKTDWYAWTKSDAHPQDIPANRNTVYKGKGWASWGHWLGTGRIATFII